MPKISDYPEARPEPKITLLSLARHFQRNTFFGEREVAEIVVLLTTAQGRLDELHKIRYELLAKLDHVQAERDMFERCMKDELARRQTLGDRVTALEARNGELGRRNQELHRALCEKTDLLPFIETERDRLKAELKETRTANDCFQSDYIRLTEDKEHLKRELDDVRKLFSQVRAELANTKNSLRNAMAESDRVRGINASLLKQCDDITAFSKTACDRANALSKSRITESEAAFLRNRVEELTQVALEVGNRYKLLQRKLTQIRDAVQQKVSDEVL